eukprot:XP_014026726.1 PREDICTED: sin3 histone deacetylase corepressor complex component SDS3 isoform X2 [Salmo salar]
MGGSGTTTSEPESRQDLQETLNMAILLLNAIFWFTRGVTLVACWQESYLSRGGVHVFFNFHDTEDASETDLAKHNEDDYVEIKEQMYQDKLASLKRQLTQLQEGTLQEYQKRMKKLDQQYKERLRNADLFLQLETEQVERNHIKEKKAAVKEFDDKKVELKENLIADLEEKKKMIENEKLTMELTGDSMEVKPIMTRKLRRRPNDPVPIPDKRRKPAPAQLNYLLTDDQIMEDLRTLNKQLKSPKRPVSPSSPDHMPTTPVEAPSQRYEARIEEGKLYYDKRWTMTQHTSRLCKGYLTKKEWRAASDDVASTITRPQPYLFYLFHLYLTR